MGHTYLTVAEPATAEFVVQGSEFIGHVRPADSVDAAEAFVDAIGEEYADATHNVPAYRVRVGGTGSGAGTDTGAGAEMDDVDVSADSGFLREYSSDDGEPSGSAGKPALNVLTQQELENCAVVVTRYYGGTNLGVGGLVRAYSRAVKEAVEEAGIVEERPHETVSIGVEYDDSGTVRGILESEGYEFEADYQASVSFEVRVPLAETDAFRDRLRSATSGRVDLE
ncbi:IMPACT family protein [Natronorubrum sp. DTA7]|uniref:IMPACT family protein n=1 Tax=Natronorubrum sp. DTA7 TaxID=3447016 RepID=UPI003F8291AD